MVWGPYFERSLRVVVVIQQLYSKQAVMAHVVLCSTNTTLPAEQIRALYNARFQLEFVF